LARLPLKNKKGEILRILLFKKQHRELLLLLAVLFLAGFLDFFLALPWKITPFRIAFETRNRTSEINHYIRIKFFGGCVKCNFNKSRDFFSWKNGFVQNSARNFFSGA